MKFEYEWQSEYTPEKPIYTGTADFESEDALRAHLDKIGGKLIRIINSSDESTSTHTPVVESHKPMLPRLLSDHDCKVQGLPPGYMLKQEDISLMMRYPDISPCAFDNNLEFWLGRMELWGKLRITYTSPTGKKEKITQGQMMEIMTDSTLINMFGRWDWKKKATNIIEFYRNYYGSDGKKNEEYILIDIDLKDNIKQAIKGKY